MPWVAAAAGVASAVVGTVGAIEQGQAAKNQANYQAQVARNNAQIAEQNADYAIQAGSQKATETSLRGAALGGRIRASIAANGIDVNSGSAADVEASQKSGSELDTLTESNNALLRAYGYRSQSMDFQAQAGLDEAAGKQAVTGSYLTAAGTLLGAASSVGGKWSGGGGVSTADSLNTMGANYGTGPDL